MSVPEGVQAPAPGMCVKLRRSIYGLKQAGRSWNERLHNTMTKLGYRRAKADPCLYLDDTDGELVTVSIHVDDCCFTYESEEKFQRFKKKLKEEFKLSESDDSNVFLGMVIERLNPEKYGERGPVYIHQAPYVEDILTRFRHQ